MIHSPFCYRFDSSDELHNGIFLNLPSFCKRNQNSSKCRHFYASLKPEDGLKLCPYGFCSEKHIVGQRTLTFTCLNIKSKSNRHEMRKFLKKDDFNPIIDLSKYIELKNDFDKDLLSSPEVDNELIEAGKEARLNIEKEALDNVLHEVKNFISQLVASADYLSDEINKKWDRAKIERLSKNIYSLTNLLSTRIEAYNLEVSPASIDGTVNILIPIFKKVEKAYKCLYKIKEEKNLNVEMHPQNYDNFEASRSLELVFFILLENAMKYAPNGSDIDINFNSTGKELTLTFSNWAIRPLSGEEAHFKERGYRGKRIVDQNEVEGRGIGFFLVHQICEALGVEIKYFYKKETHSFGDGYVYSQFVVSLHFAPVSQIY